MPIQSQLSPPWYTLWNEIKASIGNDEAVTVDPLNTSSSPFIVPITVNDNNKAVAIASIMTLHHQLGNIWVDVEVKNADGQIVTPIVPTSADDLVGMVKTALNGNGYFVNVVAQPLFPNSPPVVFPIFARSVIQFPNDDLSDLYHNYNNVVSFVFKDVLNPAPGGFGLYSSTTND